MTITKLIHAAIAGVRSELDGLPSVAHNLADLHDSAVTAAAHYNEAHTGELKAAWGQASEASAEAELTARLDFAHRVRGLRSAIRKLEVVLDGAERTYEPQDGNPRPHPWESTQSLLAEDDPVSAVLRVTSAEMHAQCARDRGTGYQTDSPAAPDRSGLLAAIARHQPNVSAQAESARARVAEIEQGETGGTIGIDEAARIVGADPAIARRCLRVIETGRTDIADRIRDGSLTIDEAEEELGLKAA